MGRKKSFVDGTENNNNDKSSMEDFIIEVTNSHDIRLPPCLEGRTEEEKEGLFLVPGQNQVSSECWSAVNKNKFVRKFINFGLLKDLGCGKALPILKTLDGLDFTEAKQCIAQENDVVQLKKWADNTENEYIRKACEAKIT